MNRRNYTPWSVVFRVIAYGLLMYGAAEAIRFDAIHPWEQGYFGEISRTEILQEIILFFLSVFYLVLGYRYRPVQPVANLVSLFFLASFVREFNFLIAWWIYPVLVVLVIVVLLVVRDHKKLRNATHEFFFQPAASWFLAGLLVTYVFSRLMGRSEFWLLMYDEHNYRMAKAATEEGLELQGDVLMLISAVEFIWFFWGRKRKEQP